jgi:uncharacterized coiled-coil DUF342 family protein
MTEEKKLLQSCRSIPGKAKRLKQAKDEATDEIEKYRNEREKQFKDFEQKVSRNCHATTQSPFEV